MQGDACVLGRARPAHAADAVVADQHGRAQAPGDRSAGGVASASVAQRGPLCRRLAAIDVVVEGEQRLVPRSEAPVVGRRRVERPCGLPCQVRAHGLPAELAPEAREIVEQVGVGNLAGLAHGQPGGLQRPVPRAEALAQCLCRERAVRRVSRRAGRVTAGLPRDPLQVAQQDLPRDVPWLELDIEGERMGSRRKRDHATPYNRSEVQPTILVIRMSAKSP